MALPKLLELPDVEGRLVTGEVSATTAAGLCERQRWPGLTAVGRVAATQWTNRDGGDRRGTWHPTWPRCGGCP